MERKHPLMALRIRILDFGLELGCKMTSLAWLSLGKGVRILTPLSPNSKSSLIFLLFQPPLLPRSRNRIQVGCTNRWRLPSVLGSDLLGSSQALKSVNSSYNDTITAVMTG